MATPVATRKRKRVSRNKKKNWRKHVNIEDVEDYLEDVRLQERTGGLVAEKSNDALYFIAKKLVSEPSAKRRRLVGKERPLKCHQSLQPDTKVKSVKRSRTEYPKSLSKVSLSEKLIKRLVNERQKGKRTDNRNKNVKGKSKHHYDLWSEDAAGIIFKNKNDIRGKIDINCDEHFLRQTNKFGVKVPNTGTIQRKPSALPSVEIPHPGASYNPTFDDHQELLKLANKSEVTKVKAAKRLYNALEGKFPKAADAPTEASKLEEMSIGIFQEAEDDDDGDVISGGISYNPPVRREDKKTITQRNKERRQEEKKKMAQLIKVAKEKEREIFQLKSIKKDISKKEDMKAKKAARLVALKAQKVYETKKLGKLRFQAPDLEVKLSEELEGSLRLLKPEGDLFQDRFKSFQKRNIIETRGKAKHKRKYKPKVFEKKGLREVTL